MSFYTSLNGMKNAQTDLGVIAHNIANVETSGFKKSRTEFADIVGASSQTNPRLISGIGATVETIRQNFNVGPVEQTGSALDFAINGDGFFTTRSAVGGQTLFTRNGGFVLDGQGYIDDGSGNRLQLFPVDSDGAVTSTTAVDALIPTSNAAGAAFAGVSVKADGVLVAAYSDGSLNNIGRVALASFVAPPGLKQVGSSNWEATGFSGAPDYGVPGEGRFGQLLSGAIERSNVDIAEELVGLITAQRNFQANSRAIDTASQITQTVINIGN